MGEYSIVIINNKTGYVAANHRDKELVVSEDISLDRTSDGKLLATFSNTRKEEPSFSDFVHDLFKRTKRDNSSDCSITIDDLRSFHYCIQKDGEYQLFGGGVTFNGTNRDDKLTMYECQNTKVNLGDGNDTVKIVGASKDGFLADFKDNIIKTENGNDTVSISGNFNKFTNNKFLLGKGNDTFKADINTEDDTNVNKASAYTKMENTYFKNVSKSTVQATDGKKGLFEKDSFESKTYSANKLLISGFEAKNVSLKSKPDKPIITPQKTENSNIITGKQTETSKKTATTVSNKKLTKEDYEKKAQAGELLYLLFNKSDGLETSFKAKSDYVESMSNN